MQRKEKKIWLGIIPLLISVLAGCSSSPGGSSSNQSPKGKTLLIVPFLGGNTEDGDGIASSLTRQPSLQNVFSIIPKTQAMNDAIGSELQLDFSRNDGGYTDLDTMKAIADQYGAEYILTGFFTQLRGTRLVIGMIFEIGTLQQVAGYYHVYNRVDEIKPLIPEMAAKLAQSTKQDSSKLPKLAIAPFSGASLSLNEAHTLAQIISCELANGTAYAVLPRTTSVDDLIEEEVGEAQTADFILVGKLESIGNAKVIASDVMGFDRKVLKGAAFEVPISRNIIDDIKKVAKRLEGTKSQAMKARADYSQGGSGW